MSATRRTFLGAAAAAPQARSATDRRKPNVLFIISDQWSPVAADLSGRASMPRTPAADSIAGSGVKFENTYCTWPLCSPSRASLFTGQMPHATGVVGNVRRQGIVPASMPTLGEIFARAGYATGYFGKEHTGGAAWRGFRHLGSYQYPGAGYLADGSGLDPVFTRDTISFIEANRSQPFLAVLSLINPHDICFTPGNAPIPGKSFMNLTQAFLYRNRFLRDLDLPAARPNVDALPPDAMGRVSANQEGWSEKEWRLYLATYFLLIENTDWLIGLVLDAIRRAALERDTIVLFTSDHGDQMGAHRLVGKGVFYEEAMRVPFALSWPGTISSGQVNRSALVSGADAVPTLCGLAGLDSPAGIEGRSLRPLVEGTSAKGRDYLISELGNGRMLRSGHDKYVRYMRGADPVEVLFDLQADPGETRNLAGSPAAEPGLRRCRGLLDTWIRETGGTFDRTRPTAWVHDKKVETSA